LTFLEVRRTRKKSQDLKPRLFHGCSLDWPELSRKKYRTPQEEIPDSPGRNTGLSRKKYRTPQEEIPNSPGRNTGLSRKKYRTLQEEIPDSPGNTFYSFPANHRILRTMFVRPCLCIVILLFINNRGLKIAREEA
jgi:hypothetical protein